MKEIHVFRPEYDVEGCLDEIRDCLQRGWTGLGYKTLEFERVWKQYTSFENAHFVSSATAGLHLAVSILGAAGGWEVGDEIITTPLTFVSTNHAILYEGFEPVFADVDSYLCLDPQSLLDRITPKTRAVMFVGLGGNAGRLGEVMEICRTRGLKLILDAAHMAGTWLNVLGEKVHAGHGADAAVFSFHSVKNLPTADGGMVCFANPEFDTLARKLSWLGIDKDTFTRTRESGNAYKWKYDVTDIGWKYHGNSVMAALGIVGLRHLERDNDKRRSYAAMYDTHLDRLFRSGAIQPVLMHPGCTPSRHLYQVLIQNGLRDKTLLFLNEQKIFPGVHYASNTDYRMYRNQAPLVPAAQWAASQLLSLPLHCSLFAQDIERVCSTLEACLT